MQKRKKSVKQLFELQTLSGSHIAWADSKASVKLLVNSYNKNYSVIRVYQLIGSFKSVPAPMVWERLER